MLFSVTPRILELKWSMISFSFLGNILEANKYAEKEKSRNAKRRRFLTWSEISKANAKRKLPLEAVENSVANITVILVFAFSAQFIYKNK